MANNTKTIDTPLFLKNMFSDIGEEPDWRGRAAKEAAWRDSYQWTKAQIQNFKDLGMPENMYVNLIAPAMDAVTGYEAQHRVDWMLLSNDEGNEEMVEGLNYKFNDLMRLADANTACSDAYSSQSGVGIGWVHVSRNPDILSPSKLLIESIHRDEMFFDMRSRSGTLQSDCRWMARRKFFDVDEAKIFFPAHKELIDFTYSDWQTIDINPSGIQADWFDSVSEYSDSVEEYMDDVSNRKRIAIYETYYKQFEKRSILAANDGFITEFNEENPLHVELLVNGTAQLHTNVPINVVREAWFIGGVCIYDGKSRAPHNQFPYVPFFGVREDASNTPQGLIRRMMGPQEEYNRAVVEIQQILRSRRVEKDEDATMGMTDQQVMHETKRADGIVNLKRGSRFAVIREWEKLAALEGICARAKAEVNAASGIYQTFQGDTEAKQSGVAVENIAKLGAQTLGKLNANYQVSRKMVGELAFAYAIEEIGTNPTEINIPQSIGQQKKTVVLNDGQNNRISMLRAQVAMQDVHTSSGYKQQTNQRLTSIMADMPEDIKVSLLPLWMESADIPKKEQAMQLINKKIGYAESEEERAAMEQAESDAQEQAKQIELQLAGAEIAEKQSNAMENQAQAENYKAEASKKRTETVKLLQEIKLARLGVTGGNPVDPRQATPSFAQGRNEQTA